jgi:hypothetical protein
MSRLPSFIALAILAVAASGCATSNAPQPQAPAAPASAPPAPGIPSEDLIGRWGFASYHKEADRARTTTAARGQCSHPYVISRGSNGGVMMYLADANQQAELVTKGGPDGKRYLGPDGPAAGPQDREFLSYDGKVMVLRWLDPEIAGRYGVSVYVRCAPKA